VAPGDGHTVYLPVPEDVDLRYALLMRELDGSTTRG
jgi:putative protease